jgi:hypothetical protein
LRILIQKHKCTSTDGWSSERHEQWISYTGIGGETVGVSEILAQIDREIAQLQRARALLNGATAPSRRAAKGKVAKKRNLTPEGRKRIAEAVKRRWAEQRKSAASDK